MSHEAIAAEHGDNHKYIIAFAVVLASLLQVIDSSIVNVALPDMMGNLGASLDEIAWVTTGYILAAVIVMPLTGWLSGFFGRSRYFIGSIILFTTASFFCGASHSLGTLIFWRIVQGVGGGALLTVSQAVLLEAFPPAEAGTAMALFGVGVMVGPTIGPTLGGWITDNYSWPWIFYINVPLGFLAAFMIAAYVHDTVEQVKSKAVDYVGILLLIAAVGSMQYLLEHGQREDWFDSRLITSLAVVGVVGSIALVWHEFRVSNPVIEFRVLRHRQMWVGTILGVVMGVGLFAASFTLPVFLQGNLHMTAQQTGLILLPGAAATAVSMAITGRITGKIDPRLLIASGAAIFAVAMFGLAAITSESGQQDFFWPLILRGIGLGMMFVPLTTVTLAQLDHAELPSGVGLYNFFRQLGGSFGIAGIATIVSHNTARYHASITEHITSTDPASLARVAALTRGFIARGADVATAHQRALAILDRQIGAQASVIAYGQTYTLAAILILTLIPLLVLVRKTKGAGGHEMVME